MPNVEIVIQFRVPGDFCTLWQRFGRAARSMGTRGTAILLAEKQFFDAEKKESDARKAKRADERKRKAEEQVGTASKRRALTKTTRNNVPPPHASLFHGESSLFPHIHHDAESETRIRAAREIGSE